MMPDFMQVTVLPISRSTWLFSALSGDRSRRRMNSQHYLGPSYLRIVSEGHALVGSGVAHWKQNKNRKHRDLSLAEFCQHYETVELWFDMRPDAQLKLIWLLDYFRSHPKAAARLKLRLVVLR